MSYEQIIRQLEECAYLRKDPNALCAQAARAMHELLAEIERLKSNG